MDIYETILNFYQKFKKKIKDKFQENSGINLKKIKDKFQKLTASETISAMFRKYLEKIQNNIQKYLRQNNFFTRNLKKKFKNKFQENSGINFRN